MTMHCVTSLNVVMYGPVPLRNAISNARYDEAMPAAGRIMVVSGAVRFSNQSVPPDSSIPDWSEASMSRIDQTKVMNRDILIIGGIITGSKDTSCISIDALNPLVKDFMAFTFCVTVLPECVARF